MGLKILVTGGAGYIGSVLVPYLLSSGHFVTVLDNLMYGARGLRGVWGHERFQFIRGDVLNEEKVYLATCGMDAVVHLAAIVGAAACKAAPELAKSVNHYGAELVAQMAHKNGVRAFLLASTCSNYGLQDRRVSDLVDETSALRPTSVYAETKIAAEQVVLALETADFHPVVARFATVFGTSPRMRFDTMVNEFTRDAFVQRRLLLYNALAWRPFVHVRDLARAIERIVLAGQRLLFHITDARTINVGGHNRRKEDLAIALLENVHELTVERREGNPDPRDYRVNFRRLEDVLMGQYWACRTPEDSIHEIVSALDADLYGDPYSERWTNAPAS
jgi:nucleoside-diphosphate-sugar epimerase